MRAIMRYLDPVTQMMLGINIVFYLYNIYQNGFNAITGVSSGQAVLAGAMGPLHNGVYEMITSMFTHLSFTHLLVNMLTIAFLGRIVYNAYGPMFYLTSYMGSGFLANLLTKFAIPDTVSAGASGSTFGMMGILLAASLIRKDMSNIKSSIALMIGLNIMNGVLMRDSINNIAHFTGLGAGVIAAVIGGLIIKKMV